MLRVSDDQMKKEYNQIAIGSKQEIKEIIKLLHVENIHIDFLLHGGKTENEIPIPADEIGVDLIVICTDCRGNIKDYVTGTITENFINKACCPVPVVPYCK